MDCQIFVVQVAYNRALIDQHKTISVLEGLVNEILEGNHVNSKLTQVLKALIHSNHLAEHLLVESRLDAP